MKTSVRKAVAVSVVLSMSLSFASCTKKTPAASGCQEASHSGDKIASDSPWYSSEITDVIPVIDMNREFESYYSHCAGSDDKYIIKISARLQPISKVMSCSYKPFPSAPWL